MDFELKTQEGINVSIWFLVAFLQRDRQDSQNLLSSVQCKVGTEKYADSGIFLNYDDDDFNQGYGQFNQAFRALLKGDFLEPYITDHDFMSSNEAK